MSGPLVGLSDERLRERLRALAWGEKQVLVAFLRHLQEFDRRTGYAPLGFSSLFRYCTESLGFSEDEAYLRIQVSRLAGLFPQALDMLSRGETHLSKLAKLSPHLTAENAATLLDEARGKTKREVERIAARFGETGPARDSVRYLPPPPAQPGELRAAAQAADDAMAPAALTVEKGLFGGPTAPVQSAPEPEQVKAPSDTRRVRIGFTAHEELLDKISRARDLLRHRNPEGRLELLVDAAFDALLRAEDPDFRPSARRRATAKAGPGSRRIPRWVKDIVWRRDGGRCVFVAPDGKRCGARDWLEYDHVRPFSLGGASFDPVNVRLLCRTHNQQRARELFGDAPR